MGELARDPSSLEENTFTAKGHLLVSSGASAIYPTNPQANQLYKSTLHPLQFFQKKQWTISPHEIIFCGPPPWRVLLSCSSSEVAWAANTPSTRISQRFLPLHSTLTHGWLEMLDEMMGLWDGVIPDPTSSRMDFFVSCHSPATSVSTSNLSLEIHAEQRCDCLTRLHGQTKGIDTETPFNQTMAPYKRHGS